MLAIKTFVVLVYNTGKKSNTCAYRFNVGAKTEKEAEAFVRDWLKKNNLLTQTRNPRTYYEDVQGKLRYKQMERVMPNSETILVVP